MTAPEDRRARVMPWVAIGAAVVAVALATIAAIRSRDGSRGGAGGESPAARVELWTAAWHAARACLVGNPQASPLIPEALAARDLVSGGVDTCARAIVDLRGATPDGDEWIEIQRHIGTLAEANLRHRVERVRTGEAAADDPLAPAVGTLDAAATRLRAAARLPPAEPSTPLAVPTLAGTPLLHDGAPLGMIEISGRGLLVRDPSTGDYATVTFFDGDPRVELAAYAGGSVWSTDGTWKLATVDRATSRTLYADPPRARLVSGGVDDVLALAALGRDDTRFAVYYDHDVRYLARSIDGGATWDKTRLPGEYGWTHAASTGGGRLDIGYWEEDGFYVLSLSVTQNATGRLPPALRVSSGEAHSSCDVGALWLVLVEDDEYAVRRADSGEIARFRKAPLIRACSSEHAVVVIDDVERLCSSTECRIVPTAADAGAGFVGETLYRYASSGDMVALWKDFADPTFARTPPGRRFAGVVQRGSDGLAVLSDEDGNVELAPLP